LKQPRIQRYQLGQSEQLLDIRNSARRRLFGVSDQSQLLAN